MTLPISRRRILSLATVQAGSCLLTTLLPFATQVRAQAAPSTTSSTPPAGPPSHNPLFDAPTSQQAINALEAKQAQPGDKILLDVPEIADNDGRVTVRVMSTLIPTDQITILVDKALRPVVAQFDLSPDIEADVSTTIKLPGNSTIRAIVKSGDQIYAVDHQIKLADESCDEPTHKPARHAGKGKKA